MEAPQTKLEVLYTQPVCLRADYIFYLIILKHKRHPGQLSVQGGGLVPELNIAGVSHEKYLANRFFKAKPLPLL